MIAALMGCSKDKAKDEVKYSEQCLPKGGT